ncbi:hypothetical protein TNCV_21861 [Trichonephila clavipes]|nr:hypothetical protein TNCV_21861 [Trichonephila clavipes]
MPRKYCIYTDSMVYSKRLKTTTIAAIQWYVQYSTLRVDAVQQGFPYRVLLATKSRGNHRQRSKRTARVGDDASAASGSAIGYEARHHASYF